MYGAVFSHNGLINNSNILLSSGHSIALRKIYLKNGQNLSDYPMLNICCDALDNDIKNPKSVLRTIILRPGKVDYTFPDLLLKKISQISGLVKLYCTENIGIEYYYIVYTDEFI